MNRLASKDRRLAELARQTNVAQFFSAVKNEAGSYVIRECFLRGAADSASVDEAVDELFGVANSHKLNVRSFKPGHEQGNPFVYELTSREQVLSEAYALLDAGYVIIVNEFIDVSDGGVSGVRRGGLAEFAPDDTPRCVEKPGVASMASSLANGLFRTVYGVEMPLGDLDEKSRLEFSVHTSPVGTRNGLTTCWEIEPSAATFDSSAVRPTWPNRYSEFLGDKTYGLLMASLLGFPVPRTTVLSRRIRPFAFGMDTGSGSVWTRTAPKRFAPGVWPTYPGFVDPFGVMSEFDPSGSNLGSIIVQQGIAAFYSGACLRVDGKMVVSGVEGRGDDYMLGLTPPSALPKPVEDAVRSVVSSLELQVGPVRLEWAFDGECVWVLQLNQDHHEGSSLLNARASSWVGFDPQDGVDALSRLIDRIGGRSIGVQLSRRVGLTSHIGDMLRSAGVPLRFDADADQPSLW